jgi:hypothetical protein
MHRCFEPGLGGCGLFRVATISSVPTSGAEKSVGYGRSPLVQTLRLACGSAPPSGKVRRQGGGWREESISGCGLARDHTPRPGLKQSLVAAIGLHWVWTGLFHPNNIILCAKRIGNPPSLQNQFKGTAPHHHGARRFLRPSIVHKHFILITAGR